MQTRGAGRPAGAVPAHEALPTVRAAFGSVLALFCGLIGGYSIPVASRIYFSDRPGVAPARSTLWIWRGRAWCRSSSAHF